MNTTRRRSHAPPGRAPGPGLRAGGRPLYSLQSLTIDFKLVRLQTSKSLARASGLMITYSSKRLAAAAQGLGPWATALTRADLYIDILKDIHMQQVDICDWISVPKFKMGIPIKGHIGSICGNFAHIYIYT